MIAGSPLLVRWNNTDDVGCFGLADRIPSFDDLGVEIIDHGVAVWYDRDHNDIQVQPSTLTRLRDGLGREAVFRLRKDEAENTVILTLCYSMFGGATNLMEGKSINFIEGAGLVYYHLVMVSCDPRGERGKAMVKHEIDMPDELMSNLKVKRHEEVYGRKTSKGDGLCVLVEKDDIETMSKVFFYEKLVPLMQMRLKAPERRH